MGHVGTGFAPIPGRDFVDLANVTSIKGQVQRQVSARAASGASRMSDITFLLALLVSLGV